MASTSPWKVTLSDIDFGLDEDEAVLAVLRSKWLSLGAKTAEFEQRFAEHVGAAHAIAVANGTAALHLALEAVDVAPGDEVIVPSLTFVATANAVLYCGAAPVFADIRAADHLVIDPEDVERKITPRTKAIIPMHYGGYSCDMDALGEIAARRGLRLVDDAAHAPGSRWRGKPIGSIGDASCFSFFSNKNLVTGEGGMVTTSDERIAKTVRTNRSHGMTASSYDKHKGHAFSYDVVSLGHNYRINEMQSALGLVQLRKLEANNAKRRALTKAYREKLSTVTGVTVPFAGQEDESSCHLFVAVLPEGSRRHEVQAAMKAKGIQTSIHYPPVHGFSSFQGSYEASVPRVDRLAGRLITLPLHPLMSEEDVDIACEALKESLG